MKTSSDRPQEESVKKEKLKITPREPKVPVSPNLIYYASFMQRYLGTGMFKLQANAIADKASGYICQKIKWKTKEKAPRCSTDFF